MDKKPKKLWVDSWKNSIEALLKYTVSNIVQEQVGGKVQKKVIVVQLQQLSSFRSH